MKCPCCRQEIDFIWRKLTAAQALALELVYEKEEDAGFWIKDARDKTGIAYEAEIRSLCLWNLVEPLDGLDGDYFVITQEGIDFLKGRGGAFTYVKYYRQYKFFAGKRVYFHDLKKKPRWRITLRRWIGPVMRRRPLGRLLRRAAGLARRPILYVMNCLDGIDPPPC